MSRKRCSAGWAFTALVLILWASPCPGEELKGPRMVFEGVVHDCGTVMEGENLENVYKVFNQGDQPLKIIRVSPG